MTRFYVAASSTEIPRARWAMDELTRRHGAGCVTLDWTFALKGMRARGLRDEDLTRSEAEAVARTLRCAIQEASIVWGLAPPVDSCARDEIGYAIGLRDAWSGMLAAPEDDRPIVVVSGPAYKRSVLFAAADHVNDSDEEALELIGRLVGR